jgi:hypothetical protein
MIKFSEPLINESKFFSLPGHGHDLEHSIDEFWKQPQTNMILAGESFGFSWLSVLVVSKLRGL